MYELHEIVFPLVKLCRSEITRTNERIGEDLFYFPRCWSHDDDSVGEASDLREANVGLLPARNHVRARLACAARLSVEQPHEVRPLSGDLAPGPPEVSR